MSPGRQNKLIHEPRPENPKSSIGTEKRFLSMSLRFFLPSCSLTLETGMLNKEAEGLGFSISSLKVQSTNLRLE